MRHSGNENSSDEKKIRGLLVVARGRGFGTGRLQKAQERMWEGNYRTFLYVHSDGGYTDVCAYENSQSGILKRVIFTVCKLYLITKGKRNVRGGKSFT